MEETKNRIYDLEERLIQFALGIISLVEKLPDNKIGNHIGGQILRSGTSPALNYGEAQAAESKTDFIHKMKICLKELRETRVSLKIIIRKPLVNNITEAETLLKECSELISIFAKSIDTAKKNNK
ncbi:MAG: four helix bundle protein [Ignavibacteriales bacterium]|nr:four helix bundle protein [Ignavibacteriales bacterium]